MRSSPCKRKKVRGAIPESGLRVYYWVLNILACPMSEGVCRITRVMAFVTYYIPRMNVRVCWKTLTQQSCWQLAVSALAAIGGASSDANRSVGSCLSSPSFVTWGLPPKSRKIGMGFWAPPPRKSSCWEGKRNVACRNGRACGVGSYSRCDGTTRRAREPREA